MQYTRTGTSCLMSYCLLLIVILHFYPGHLSYTIKALDLKLHRMIDLIEQKSSAEELVLCTSCFMSYCPLIMVIAFYPGHLSYTIKAVDLKLHRMIDLIEQKSSAQEMVFCTSCFMSYCPLIMVILHFYPGHLSYTIKALDLKLHRMLDLMSYCPLIMVILHFYSGHLSYTIKALDLKLHRISLNIFILARL